MYLCSKSKLYGIPKGSPSKSTKAVALTTAFTFQPETLKGSKAPFSAKASSESPMKDNTCCCTGKSMLVIDGNS